MYDSHFAYWHIMRVRVEEFRYDCNYFAQNQITPFKTNVSSDSRQWPIRLNSDSLHAGECIAITVSYVCQQLTKSRGYSMITRAKPRHLSFEDDMQWQADEITTTKSLDDTVPEENSLGYFGINNYLFSCCVAYTDCLQTGHMLLVTAAHKWIALAKYRII
jgi:hypothetical protein